jgi:hypothetical protein
MNDQADWKPGPDNLKATKVLDFTHEYVKAVSTRLGSQRPADRDWLQRAHEQLVKTLHPIYSVNEWQPASATLNKARGSCSQRMACLEAVARAAGIPTRIRALYVKGSFWYPRFRTFQFFIPNKLLLMWPQFFLEGKWVDFDELHAPMAQLAATQSEGFANNAESLFEAVRNTPVDFLGKTCGLACSKPGQDLSGFVLADKGFFNSRDEALERFGSFQYTVRGRVFERIFGEVAS